MAPTRRQAIIWTNAYPVNRRIYAALGGDELRVHKKTHLTHKNNIFVSLDSIQYIYMFVYLMKLCLKGAKPLLAHWLHWNIYNQDNLAFIWLDRCNIIQIPLSFHPATTTIEEFSIFMGLIQMFSDSPMLLPSQNLWCQKFGGILWWYFGR